MLTSPFVVRIIPSRQITPSASRRLRPPCQLRNSHHSLPPHRAIRRPLPWCKVVQHRARPCPPMRPRSRRGRPCPLVPPMHCPLSWHQQARGLILLGTSGPFGMVARRTVGRRSAVLLLGLNDIDIFSYSTVLIASSCITTSGLSTLFLAFVYVVLYVFELVPWIVQYLCRAELDHVLALSAHAFSSDSS